MAGGSHFCGSGAGNEAMLIETCVDNCGIAPLLASFRLQQRTTIASYIAALEVLINLRNVVHVLVEVDDVTMSEEIISINQSFFVH